MKECPHCGKEVLEKAVKCRYCKKYLDDNENKIEEEKIETKKRPNIFVKIIAWAFLLLGLFMILLVLFLGLKSFFR